MMETTGASPTTDPQHALKLSAAHYAVEHVESGMIVGLGHGSTALHAVRRIAERLREGSLRDILAIPCSLFILEESRRLDITLTTLDEHPVIDLTIDGADEVDPQLNLIKGGGGALLREKIVAEASRREIIIIDESKLSPVLGTRWAVPVEVIPLACKTAVLYLESIGARVTVRNGPDGNPFLTDQKNYIVDCHFGTMPDPRDVAEKIKKRAGIVEHGLFIGIATKVIVAGREGIRTMERASAQESG